MQATISALGHGDLISRYSAAAIDVGALLRRPSDLTTAMPPQHALPPQQLPAPWRPVPGSQIITVAQRFAAYTRDHGPQVLLHSVLGLDIDIASHPVARLNLGRHRVAVHTDTAGCEAGWRSGEVVHRLAAKPITLGDFMELLHSLDWRMWP